MRPNDTLPRRSLTSTIVGIDADRRAPYRPPLTLDTAAVASGDNSNNASFSSDSATIQRDKSQRSRPPPSPLPVTTRTNVAAPHSANYSAIHDRHTANRLQRSSSNDATGGVEFDGRIMPNDTPTLQDRACDEDGEEYGVGVDAQRNSQPIPNRRSTSESTGDETHSPGGSSISLSSSASTSFSRFTLFFDSLPLEYEYRYTLLSGIGGSGMGSIVDSVPSTSSTSSSPRHLLIGIVVCLLMSFASFSPDVWSLEEDHTSFRNRLILASCGAFIFLNMFVLHHFKARYQRCVMNLTTTTATTMRSIFSSQTSSVTAQTHSTTNGGGAGVGAGGVVDGVSHGSSSVQDRLSRFLSFQPLLALLFCIGGCCWSTASVLYSSELHSITQSGPTIMYLLIGFLMFDIFLFAHLCMASMTITLVYIIIVGVSRMSDELWIQTLSKCLNVSIATFALCYYAYLTESHLRRTFVKSKALVTTKRELQRETAELRSEVFSLVLEKFDIVDVTKPQTGDQASQGGRYEINLDLTSPLERSMKLLQELECDRTLSKKHFDKIRIIIEQLGSSNDDIFRPRMSQIVGSATRSGYFRNARTSANSSLGSGLVGVGVGVGARRGSIGSTSLGIGCSPSTFAGVRSGIGSDANTVVGTANGAAGGAFGNTFGSPPSQPHSFSRTSNETPIGSPHTSRGGVPYGTASPPIQLDDDTTKWLSGLVDDETNEEHSSYDDRTMLESHTMSKAASPTHLSNLLSSEEEQTIHVLTEQLTEWSTDTYIH